MQTIKLDFFTKTILSSIALGIWILVIQNMLPAAEKDNSVYVKGGSLSISGGRVEVSRIDEAINVDLGRKRIDVNIDAINGHSNAFYDFGGDGNHVRIPVMTTYPSGY